MRPLLLTLLLLSACTIGTLPTVTPAAVLPTATPAHTMNSTNTPPPTPTPGGCFITETTILWSDANFTYAVGIVQLGRITPTGSTARYNWELIRLEQGWRVELLEGTTEDAQQVLVGHEPAFPGWVVARAVECE